MLFALIAHDKAGALQTRLDTRSDHVAYLKSSAAVQQAGPLLNEAGEMSGSLILLDLPDLDAAKTWAAADPYAKAGLFEKTQIIAWNRVIG